MEGIYMKKIGILTFQRAINYGAVLQMYALQKIVRNLGGIAEIIDYDCRMISYVYKPFPFRALYHPKILIRTLYNYNIQKSRNRKFAQFEKKYMNFSEKLVKNELIRISDSYDTYIVGSDQVWNPFITGGDTAYFLDFVKNNHKKFSYAASFGISSWPREYKIPVGSLMELFRSISIREKTGSNIVRKLTTQTPPLIVSVDPVFLLDCDEWRRFVNASTEQKPYIFIYVVGSGNQSDIYYYAEKLAKEKNLNIINLRYNKSLRHKEFNLGHMVYDASPDEFVSYIGNAACVVTDSFHATAFSVIFHKDMYVSKPHRVSSRITDLFDLTGIQGRFIGEPLKKIHWDKVDKHLEKAKADSLAYLKSIVEA